MPGAPANLVAVRCHNAEDLLTERISRAVPPGPRSPHAFGAARLADQLASVRPGRVEMQGFAGIAVPIEK
jgi:hypothetical protein